MNELVFIEPNKTDAVPFTTSEIIAECAGVKHHTVTRLIQQHMDDFEEFGVLRFKIDKPPAGSKGGRPTKVYHLNEEQATLLLTYLKNTPQVRAFKKELVRQFYLMRQELLQRQANRAALKPIRRELTDAIRDCVPETPHKRWVYKQYTDLAYKAAVGMTAAQLRKLRGAPKSANAADYMSADEIAAVSKRQNQIAVLLEMGLNYPGIRDMVLSAAVNRVIAAQPAASREQLGDAP